MATATFIHAGSSIDYTPTAAVAAGDVIVQANLVGVATRPIAANELGALAVAGVFDFPKSTGAGSAIPIGSTVYWDATGQVATTSAGAGANELLGKTTLVNVDADATVRVRLSQ